MERLFNGSIYPARYILDEPSHSHLKQYSLGEQQNNFNNFFDHEWSSRLDDRNENIYS